MTFSLIETIATLAFFIGMALQSFSPSRAAQVTVGIASIVLVICIAVRTF